MTAVRSFAAALALLLLLPLQASAAETWQASREFQIDAAQMPGRPAGAVVARYRLLDQLGKPAGPLVERPIANLFDRFQVPSAPGAYKLEAWTVDDSGAELSRASASLRFDDVPPPAPGAGAPTRWLRGEEVARLDLAAPTEALPLSGLRGYAISLDREDGEHPCAGPPLCTPAETDVAAALADEPVTLGTLPEGTNFARVVAVSGAGVSSPVRSATFRVDGTDPRLSVTGIPTGWSDRPVSVRAHATDFLSGMAAAGPTGPITALSVDGGAPTTSAGDAAAAWVSGSGVHAIDALARDAAGNVGGELAGSGSAATVRIDEDPPHVAFAASQDPVEPERIEARVADSLSGPSPTSGSISLRLAGTRARFEALPTRVAAGRLVARWDSDAYPPGKYEFLATGFDAAGNAALGTDRERGGRMVLVNPLKTPVSLRSKLSRGRLSGRLRRLDGGGVAGQRVLVVETFAVGAAPERRTTFLETDAKGAFSLRLQPGPSRDVVASFAGTPTLTGSSGPSACFGVPTGLRFRASAAAATVGGRPVVFSGTVGARGAREAVGGLPVELQFRYPGAGWRGFRTVEADRRGRFRYAYRFSDDDSRGVRFRFRAHVKGREGWPYEPGTSRPETVTGR
ncbi:MAG TPA: hypothetical protein VFN92_05195 [Solirubrobacterales bacterium]|nr:hypothetical protein [Solirubrobacterales bacterium]